jgi:pimeloyl-ACP methyl ester carboxylesterase
MTSTTRVMRPEEWSDPPAPVHREVLTAHADPDSTLPPVLFVPGFGHAAWVYAEHWLEHTAERGFPAYAMSLRGHGASGPGADADLRAYVHDVVQVAAALPRRAILIGSGAGALVVAMALARYPARAGVLLAPAFGGMAAGLAALRRNPLGTLPGLFGRPLRLRGTQLFSSALSEAVARDYVTRLGGASGRAQRQLIRRQDPEAPVGDPPVLVAGSPDDRVVARAELDRVARRYGGAPLLFPGMGHDLMLDAGWPEPIEAIVDWLEKACA